MELKRKNLNFKNSSDITALAEQVLNASRQELYLCMRHMFIALNAFSYERDHKTAFTATDGDKIYYNPMKLIAGYRDNPVIINRAILHMTLHCIFRHLYSCGEKDREVWNLACDISVEYIIDGLSLSAVLLPDNDARQQVYNEISKEVKIFSAQNIHYFLLKRPREYKDSLEAVNLFGVDDHDYWYIDNDRDNDRKNDEKSEPDKKDDKDDESAAHNNAAGNMFAAGGSSEKKWDSIAKKIETQIGICGAGRGDEKGNFSRMLKAGNKRKITYSGFLRKFAVLKERMHIDPDSFDYGFYNYSMQLYKNMPLFEELEYKEEYKIEDFVIVLDTSGSCSADLIDKFLDITYEILSDEKSFFDRVRIHIIQCDNKVQSDIIVTDRKAFEEFKQGFMIKGFGGTDFRPAFNYVNSLIDREKLNPRGLIYFTDGYGIYPKQRPPYETAFIFINEYEENEDFPGWAIRLVIDEDNLK